MSRFSLRFIFVYCVKALSALQIKKYETDRIRKQQNLFNKLFTANFDRKTNLITFPDFNIFHQTFITSSITFQIGILSVFKGDKFEDKRNFSVLTLNLVLSLIF